MDILKPIFHSTRRAIAKIWLDQMNVTQIAITGSQGKTAVSQGLYAMLSTIRPTVVTDTNLDTIYNVPITALKTRPYHHFVIFELGIDKIGEMDFHLEIVRPKIAVITGVSPVHSDKSHMKSFENVIAQKRVLLEKIEVDASAVLNYSDPNVRSMAKSTKAKIYWYGKTEDKPADSETPYVGYSDLKVSKKGTEFLLTDFGNGEKLNIKTQLIGVFNGEVICAIYTILKILNPMFVMQFDQGVLELLKPLRGRMNIEDGPKDTTILNDSLRASPTSTMSGLVTFASIQSDGNRKIAILADMGELEDPEGEHRKIGKLLATLPINIVICTGKMQKFVAMEASRNKNIEVHYYDSVADAKGEVMSMLRPKDFIYLKGSLYSKVGAIFN